MTHVHDAVIVGAGFGGMGAAIQLRRLGYDDLLIIERESDVGGTWHVNRYPGLAVDIPSATYSYSFEPNPFWSRLYAPGPELKRYATHVAEKYDLRRHLQLDTAVTGASWDESSSTWEVATDSGETHRARFLLPATGFLSQPHTPDFPGMADFRGEVVHTAAWPEHVELAGRRVGIIGTGATAVQLIPELAKQARHLTVFQRTPIWVSPKLDGPVPRVVQQAFARLPLTQKAARLTGTAILEVMMVAGVLHYRDLPAAHRLAARFCRAHLHRQVSDPELRAKLTPRYSFGCKRPTYSNDYYPTLCRDDVHLQTGTIDHLDADGIVTVDDGTQTRADLDVLVLATGFDLWETNFPAFRIVGREGRDLGKWWRQERFVTYEGISIPRFPNLMLLNSPYAYSGLSYFTTIEYQMRHMERLLASLQQRGADVFEVTEEATDAFVARMKERLEDSVFVQGDCATAHSYYFNQHGEAVLLRPTSSLDSRRESRRFPLDDYRFRRAGAVAVR
ncbi:MAG TPA: NAD(P)/FAD-dependent oxidoreductase [Nocardioides sp.]|nr:NAD(P)/FAD-dependent oxidoreductase [Nocardioides sp.]